MPRDLPEDITHPTIASSLTHHSIPLQTWKNTNPSYNNLAIGAFILRLSPTTPPKPQLLLLKRASTDSYPNVWEPPGGSVDLSDLTLFHGLIREVWEESGLRVKDIQRQVWDGKEGGREEVSFFGGRGEKWCKLNFLVEVLEGEVALDEAEHQDWGWFGREEMEAVEFISQQGKEIARNAFMAFEEGDGGKQGNKL